VYMHLLFSSHSGDLLVFGSSPLIIKSFVLLI
jgi:hypothetical protein